MMRRKSGPKPSAGMTAGDQVSSLTPENPARSSPPARTQQETQTNKLRILNPIAPSRIKSYGLL